MMKLLEKLENWYNKISFNTILAIALMVSLLTIFQISISHAIPIFTTISLFFVFLAFIYKKHEFSFHMFMISMFFFVISCRLMLIIPCIIAIYLAYVLIDNHRIKRLVKLSEMSPDQIAGIKKQKGQSIDIIIKTGGGKR